MPAGQIIDAMKAEDERKKALEGVKDCIGRLDAAGYGEAPVKNLPISYNAVKDLNNAGAAKIKDIGQALGKVSDSRTKDALVKFLPRFTEEVESIREKEKRMRENGIKGMTVNLLGFEQFITLTDPVESLHLSLRARNALLRAACSR